MRMITSSLEEGHLETPDPMGASSRFCFKAGWASYQFHKTAGTASTKIR
jgi:hypothetical protein